MKMHGKFQSGGWGKGFSKCIVTGMSGEEVELAEAFKPDAICFWASSDSGDQVEIADMLQKLMAFQGNCVVKVADRVASLKAAMAEHPKWGGSITKHEGFLKEDEWKLGAKFLHSNRVGAPPWLVCWKPWAWRYGPSQWPLPGMGCFIMGVEESADTRVGIMPIAPVLAQGISLQDVHKFLETPTAQTMWKDSGRIIQLKPSSCCWVPYGHLVFPIGSRDLDSEEQHKSKKGDSANSLCFLWVFVPFVSEWAEQLSQPCLAAIRAWNQEHLQQKKALPLWEDRHSVVEAFFQNLSS